MLRSWEHSSCMGVNLSIAEYKWFVPELLFQDIHSILLIAVKDWNKLFDCFL